jgi:branched-chain amino acid transport system ATP-binding protein
MPAALRVERLITGYGTRQILEQVDLEVSRGEVVAVIGHNGAGKSTLLKAVFGLLPVWSGEVVFPAIGTAVGPRALLRHGVAYAPQGNRVFHRLTVIENLQLSGVVLDASRRRQSVGRALELFPALRGRERQRAGTLSGGEKQMLALACVMSLDPHLLLLDEPTLGLSPSLTKNALTRISKIAKDASVGCLVVEQKVRQVLCIADRVYVLRNGKVAFRGPTVQLADEAKLREVYL